MLETGLLLLQVVEHVAAHLGLDGTEVRQRNFWRPEGAGGLQAPPAVEPSPTLKPSVQEVAEAPQVGPRPGLCYNVFNLGLLQGRSPRQDRVLVMCPSILPFLSWNALSHRLKMLCAEVSWLDCGKMRICEACHTTEGVHCQLGGRALL